ncbi:restriction endonuclease subunit S [Flavivirga rizhaonensis]|uniref:Type I restriction modification DNA specificity domain-containing protein n=1 Tax=Flavivirga rizhaonensis TaxID=2559571 RepID=A0A4S1E0C0_9FLAO|nr:restriction endonuclease subunit S [Flavivirga rizhaonensis]TGV03348.1 hypothetical protein EM932_06650 [Flavivirga rizhaonensis]
MNEELKFPNNWVKVTLNDICLTSSGGTPNRKNSSFYNGDIPWVKSGELNYNVILKSEEVISEEALKKSSAKIFPKGTLLIALYGATVGRLAFLGINAATNQAVASIMCFAGMPNRFLYYYLLHKKEELLQKRVGGAQRNISQRILNNLKIPLPPLAEQKRIVSFVDELFSDLDKGEESLKLAQNQLKVYRQTLLKIAFEGKLSKQWRKNNSPDEADKLLKVIKKERKNCYEQELREWNRALDNWKKIRGTGKKPKKPKVLRIQSEIDNHENLTDLPSQWKWIKVGEFEKHIGSGSTPKGGKNVYLDKGIPLIRSMNIYPNKLVLDGLTFIDRKTHEKMERSQLKEKDVLLNITGASIGRCTYLPQGFGESNVNQHVCIIRSFTDMIDYKYLCQYLNSPIAQRIIQMINSGATREALTFEQIRNFPFPLSTREEQKVIVNELESNFFIINNLERTIQLSIQQSEALRQSILKKAFAGKLVSENSSDETAIEFLNRIKSEKREYIQLQNEEKKKKPKKHIAMSKKLSIEDVLKSSDEPMLAVNVWQASKHKDNIEEFYAELKKIQKNIKEVKKGTEALLTLIA